MIIGAENNEDMPYPGRTGRRFAASDIRSLFSVIVPAMIFAALMISAQPFATQSTIQPSSDAGGDTVNQIGYSLLGMMALAGMVMIAVPRRVAAVLDPAWLFVITILVVAALISPDPSSALRSLAFTVIVVMTCIGILTIPQNENQLRQVFLIGVGAAIAISYFGVVFQPDLAVHSAASNEPQHVGLWRGHFSHKNIAGPVMAVFVLFGIYFMRSGNRVSGALITLLATIFVLQTGSKTTIGFLPVAIGVVLIGAVFGSRLLTFALSVLLIAAIAALTVGTVVWKPMAEAAAILIDDPTFTGRTTLWEFGIENIANRFWTGYGYDGFWLKPVVTRSDIAFDTPWDYRFIVHGHNNFIDILLMAGVPAGFFLIVILCLRPLVAFVRSARYPANRHLADLFAMILIFAILNSQLESFWFRRADPIWILMVLAIFGLRLTSRLPFSGGYRLLGPA